VRIADGRYHLTYCTNVHPGRDWPETRAGLEEYLPPLRARFAPDAPFGVGLRLSGLASSQLLEGDELARLRADLDVWGCYVFTMNGFPYGPFHGETVKANVHAPDWRDEERVAYTLRMVDALAELLPDGLDGGISTSPLSYGAWVEPVTDAIWERLTANIVAVADRLVRLHGERGVLIHLDIEPEPDGLLGDCAALIDYFERWLLPAGGRLLAERFGIDPDAARAELLDHVRVCFDTCHVAVGYEDPAGLLDRFAALGIRVGKVQISSALKVAIPNDDALREDIAASLRPFNDDTYLHQVIQRNAGGTLTRYPDLDDALPALADEALPELADEAVTGDEPGRAEEWRVHFHVPIFVDRFDVFDSTQDAILTTFAELARRGDLTNHLEIETYTWDVLPAELKGDLLTSISREYEWVLRHVNG